MTEIKRTTIYDKCLFFQEIKRKYPLLKIMQNVLVGYIVSKLIIQIKDMYLRISQVQK